jgi:hypothetical protein
VWEKAKKISPREEKKNVTDHTNETNAWLGCEFQYKMQGASLPKCHIEKIIAMTTCVKVSELALEEVYFTMW